MACLELSRWVLGPMACLELSRWVLGPMAVPTLLLLVRFWVWFLKVFVLHKGHHVDVCEDYTTQRFEHCELTEYHHELLTGGATCCMNSTGSF